MTEETRTEVRQYTGSGGVCLITCERIKTFHSEDILLKEELEKRGVPVVKPYVWTDPDFDFTGIALAVIRTPWDYYLDSPKFISWLRTTSQKVTVANDAETVEKNMHKSYLRELEDDSVHIVPTVFLDKGSSLFDVTDAMEAKKWDEAVFKPAVGASAYGLHKLRREEIDEKTSDAIQKLLDDGDALVQPFIATVQWPGELSVIFFNNEYSHAILKLPNKGEYKVQGGLRTPYNPSPNCVKTAAKALEVLSKKGPMLYARVDMLFGKNKDEFLVSELELIEPQLWLNWDAPSAGKFAAGMP